jgi:hypothetical protein
MEQTPLLKLPYIMPAQAQKHVTHNEALRMLDAILHIRVEDVGRNDPPPDPLEGQRHAVGPGATGAFAGHAGAIAAFQDGAWNFYPPEPGWTVWSAADSSLLVFDGSGWKQVCEQEQVSRLGVHAAADDANRLSVSANATLLSHDGAGHQLKINKAGVSDTGSLLFQTGWSGRAEMGLAGTDNFSVKVSSGGASWLTALEVDKATGAVTLPHTRLAAGSADGQVQHRAGNGFAADAYFTYNATTKRLCVGTTITNGTVNAHATNGVPCLYLTADTGLPYLQMQNGAVWQGVSGGDVQFITGADGGFIFALRRPAGSNTVALWIDRVGRTRVGSGAPAGEAQFSVDGAVRVGASKVATLPSAGAVGAGAILFVPDEVGGATLAFSDGAIWRRVTDRAAVA